jgi:hypothetical protein
MDNHVIAGLLYCGICGISRLETREGPPHHRALSLIRAYRHCNLGLLLLNSTAQHSTEPRSHLACAGQAKLLRPPKFQTLCLYWFCQVQCNGLVTVFPLAASFPSALQDSRACLLCDRVSPATGPEPLIECEWRGCRLRLRSPSPHHHKLE